MLFKSITSTENTFYKFSLHHTNLCQQFKIKLHNNSFVTYIFRLLLYGVHKITVKKVHKYNVPIILLDVSVIVEESGSMEDIYDVDKDYKQPPPVSSRWLTGTGRSMDMSGSSHSSDSHGVYSAYTAGTPPTYCRHTAVSNDNL